MVNFSQLCKPGLSKQSDGANPKAVVSRRLSEAVALTKFVKIYKFHKKGSEPHERR